MENLGFLLAAFGLIWAVFFGYLFYLMTRQRRLSREISELKEAVTAKE